MSQRAVARAAWVVRCDVGDREFEPRCSHVLMGCVRSPLLLYQKKSNRNEKQRFLAGILFEHSYVETHRLGHHPIRQSEFEYDSNFLVMGLAFSDLDHIQIDPNDSNTYSGLIYVSEKQIQSNLSLIIFWSTRALSSLISVSVQFKVGQLPSSISLTLSLESPSLVLYHYGISSNMIEV